ncbi:MAG: beta-hydroxyacyl-ACP dehydratase [Planctomycetales bacterium]|nr:beta-hydroxyacyl-ACP dehydratase [Planctomycetales bacterium]
MSDLTIESLLPHRPPMLLVDEIVEKTEKTIHCRKVFAEHDFFVQGHFPNFPLVPGVILCECALQAGAMLVSSLSINGVKGVPVVTRLDAVKFKRMVRPGEVVDIHVTLSDALSNAFFMTARVTVDGKMATRLEFACTFANVSEI